MAKDSRMTQVCTEQALTLQGGPLYLGRQQSWNEVSASSMG